MLSRSEPRKQVELTADQREQLSLIAEKDGNGHAVYSDDPVDSEWVYIHTAFAERRRLRDGRMRPAQLGYHYQITFAEPVSGPVCIGDSSHFGLGVFKAKAESLQNTSASQR